MAKNFQSVCEAVLFHAANSPAARCLADEGGSVTYGEYAEKIKKTASALLSFGIRKGDKVVVEASQTIDFAATGLAVQLLGAVFVPIEHRCHETKAAHFASLSGAALTVSEKECTSMPCACVTCTQLSQKASTAAAYEPTFLPEADDICEILFSTGTTGKEKGILITNGNNIALSENVIHGVAMQADNVELIPSPLNHSHGLRRYYANMVNGSCVVLFGSIINMYGFFEMMDRYAVNSLDMVPTALSVMLKLSEGKIGEYADRLRYIQFGSAPLVQKDKDALKALLPHTRLYNFYGSTESGCICIYDFHDGIDKRGCIGKPTVNAQIMTVDADRAEVRTSAEHTGFLASRGSMNMQGYYLDEAETAKVQQDGILYTNDEIYLDEDGDIILLGRVGDVINVGGNKVSPEEIEDIVKKLPGIRDCGCVPVPGGIRGQVPKLFVVMEDGHSFDERKIRAFITENAEPYKMPKYIVCIDALPRSYNGKLLRRKLSEL